MLEQIENDSIPKQRLGDAATARAILKHLVEADALASKKRAEIMRIIDGAPPYTEDDLIRLGNRDKSNVNWGAAGARIEDALIPYYDLIFSPETLVNVRVHAGDAAQRHDWSSVIAEEMHRTLVEWGGNKAGFIHNEILCVKNMIIHGVGAVHWRSSSDFRYSAIERKNIYVSRSAPSNVAEITEVFIRDTIPASKLYGYIRDKDTAEATGWNVEAVMEVLKTQHSRKSMNAEDMESLWKENSLRWDRVESNPIPVVHCYIVEFSGKVSHFIACESGEQDFLYAAHEEYDAIHNCIWMCLADVGNGNFHSVRGLGLQAAQFGRAQNYMNNSLIDSAVAGGTIWWTTDSAENIARVPSIQLSHGRVLPAGFQPQQINTAPAINAALTVSQTLSMHEANQTGQYRSQALAPRGIERTATEIETEVMERTKLTSAKVEHYLSQKDILMREVYRRLALNPIVRGESGYKEIKRFRDRLRQRGVPDEILEEVDVSAARSVGNGSASDRRVRYNRMMSVVAMMPEQKRDVFVRDYIATECGSREWADRYGPDVMRKSQGIDRSLAILENNNFATVGAQDPFSIDNKHPVHLEVHYEYVQSLIQRVQEETASPSEVAPILARMVAHMSLHVEAIRKDATRLQEANNWESAVGSLNNAIKQIERMALEEQQMKEQQERPDPELLKAQAQIDIMQRKAQAEIEVALMKAQQEMSLKDVQTASQIRKNA